MTLAGFRDSLSPFLAAAVEGHAAEGAHALLPDIGIAIRKSADHYAIADRLAENSFIDLNFRVGAGRSADEKKRTGEALFAAASAALAPLFDTPHFALSLEIREIDAELSWKKNAIHPRLRGK